MSSRTNVKTWKRVFDVEEVFRSQAGDTGAGSLGTRQQHGLSFQDPGVLEVLFIPHQGGASRRS
jgi:hypothetical protein